MKKSLPRFEDLNLSMRAGNFLLNNGINTTRKLVALNRQDVLRIQNIGWVTLKEIEKKLAGVSLALRTTSEPSDAIEKYWARLVTKDVARQRFQEQQRKKLAAAYAAKLSKPLSDASLVKRSIGRMSFAQRLFICLREIGIEGENLTFNEMRGDIRKAIIEKRLRPGCPKFYGAKTHSILCRWVRIDPVTFETLPNT